MSYYFIEKSNPLSDPNIDLNFDNDILYSDILRDEIDKYNTSYIVDKDEAIPMRPNNLRQQNTKKSDNKKNNMYILFIIFAVVLIGIWYVYGNKIKKQILTGGNSHATYHEPELATFSPDFGNNTRYMLRC
jgi:hypothetical protein